jgi:dsDNA-specific endonuclease/ATPase MutS2
MIDFKKGTDLVDYLSDDSFPEIVELPLEDVLDLHSFPPNEIKALVENYLQDAYEAGFPEVRVIHGKGIGVQREIVRSVATQDSHVHSVIQAPEEAGGWGATIIRFYPQNNKKN